MVAAVPIAQKTMSENTKTAAHRTEMMGTPKGLREFAMTETNVAELIFFISCIYFFISLFVFFWCVFMNHVV